MRNGADHRVPNKEQLISTVEMGRNTRGLSRTAFQLSEFQLDPYSSSAPLLKTAQHQHLDDYFKIGNPYTQMT